MRTHPVKRSIKASLQDSVAWATMCGLTEPYAVPFALGLGATPFGVGLLRSLPYLFSSISQLFAEKFVLAMGRCKKALLLSVLTQALSLFAAAGSVFLPGLPGLVLFTGMMVVYTVAGTMAAPPWSALMGEYLPASKRGNFFGFRYQIVGVAFFTASYLGARLLGFFGEGNLKGFFLLFAAGGALRLLSYYYITFMHEARNAWHMPRSGRVGFPVSLDFRKGRVPALYFSVFMLLSGAFIAAPFFGVYALQDLKCSYPQYMVLVSAGPLFTYLFMKRWGQAADSFGSVLVMKAGFLLIPLVPLLWTFSRNFYYLAAVECFSGIVWGAYLIGMTNFIYETAPAHERAGYMALFNFVAGMSQFAGALTGGFLYDRLPPWFGSSFIPLLLLSALLRGAAALPLFRLVGETRPVRKARPLELFLHIMRPSVPWR